MCGNSNSNCSVEFHDNKFDDSQRKSVKAIACIKGNIEVTLEGKTLWDEFYRRGTEMIVNRAGRYTFLIPLLLLCIVYSMPLSMQCALLIESLSKHTAFILVS